MKCDHIIGYNEDEGVYFVRLSVVGEFRYIDEIFPFCPSCGEKIKVTQENIERARSEYETERINFKPILTSSIITRESLKILNNTYDFIKYVKNNGYDESSVKSIVNIRKPNRHVKGETK